MATYSDKSAIKFDSTFNINDTGGNINFTVPAGKYYEIACLSPNSSSSTMTVVIGGRTIYNGAVTSAAPLAFVVGMKIGAGITIDITGANVGFTLFGNYFTNS